MAPDSACRHPAHPFDDQDFDEAQETLSERFYGLADTAAGRGGANGNVSNDDIRALRDNPDIPFELIEALS